MITQTNALCQSTEILPASEPGETVQASREGLLARLGEWFDVEFYLVDGNTGDPLVATSAEPAGHGPVRAELCRAVACRGKAEIIEESDPLVVLAVPVQGSDQQTVAAVGTFASGNVAAPAQMAEVRRLLRCEAPQAERWLAAQHAWPPEVLRRMGQLATERLGAEPRLKTLDREVRELTLNLSSTYEEISLIYRLTQNLKLTSGDDELANLALEWLADVLPAECLAIELLPPDRSESDAANRDPLILSHGTTVLEDDALANLVAHFRLVPGKRPLIVNASTTSRPDWPWPEIRQLIVVSLCEGTRCFGWLAVANRVGGGEFGTVEASLLSSVAAILGIHSGNATLYRDQRELFKGMVRALTSAIDAKDPYTCGHSDRVARVSVRLAEEMGCDAKQIDTIYLAGLLHDVGKIGIDDDVLRKPGKLTDAEYEHIKTHAEIGHRILSDIKQLDDVLPAVRYHHEQWNGKGYPLGLAGEQIPLLARIVAVADAFDAMGSDRPYRPGMPDEKLDAVLRDGAGTQWDATVVEAFFRARRCPRNRPREETEPVAGCSPVGLERHGELARSLALAGELAGEHGLERLHAQAHGHHVAAESDHAAPLFDAAVGIAGAGRHDAPGLAVLAARRGHSVDRIPDLLVLGLPQHAERLRQIGRADEQQVDRVDGRNRVGFLESPQGFDLDRDEMVAIGVVGQFDLALVGEMGIGPLGVQSPHAARGELGPADELLGLGGRANLGGHYAVDPRLERLGHRRIAGYRQPQKASQPAGLANQGGHRDLFGGDAGMLGVEPKAVVTAGQAEHLQGNRVDQPTAAEDPNDLVGGQ